MTVECRYFSASAAYDSPGSQVGTPVTNSAEFEVGALVWLLCRDTTTGVMVEQRLVTWDPANPPVLAPSAEVLAQLAANRLTLPVPDAQTWPPAGGRGLVHLPVWLHVKNWAPLAASASAGGLTATVEAVPVRAEWDTGDGTVTCSDAGTRYDPATRPDPASSSCSFTYARSSGGHPGQAFPNTVTVVWHLRWTATNGQGGDLGEVSSPTTAFALQIQESQALVAPPRY